MLDRTTAEAALEAFQRTAAARREYGRPIDAAMAAASLDSAADYRQLGCYWLTRAGASPKQIDAAWELAKLPSWTKFTRPVKQFLAALDIGERVLAVARAGDIGRVRLALACLDQGDVFRRVTPERLVEVLCWEEQPS